jgi:hypothetical protein
VPDVQLTPELVQAKLRWLDAKLSEVQTALAVSRDLEVDAKIALNRERRKVLLSGTVPKVRRDEFTAAERDAWVDREVADLLEAHQRAEVARDTAADHLKTLLAQVDVVRSLNASVRKDMELAGAMS